MIEPRSDRRKLFSLINRETDYVLKDDLLEIHLCHGVILEIVMFPASLFQVKEVEEDLLVELLQRH